MNKSPEITLIERQDAMKAKKSQKVHNISNASNINDLQAVHKTRSRPVPPLTTDQIARFWSHVDVRGPDECWLWTGGVSVNSHGQKYGLWNGSAGPLRPHRVAWTLKNGPIPEGLTIDHVQKRGCTSTLCCNDAHLDAVTHGENTRRYYRALTTCKRGHPRKPMSGTCMICKHEQDRVRSHKRRERIKIEASQPHERAS